MMQVIPDPLESVVVHNSDLNVYISRGSTALTRSPLLIQPEPCAAIDTLRNLNRQFSLTPDATLTETRRARMIDQLSGTGAIGTIRHRHHGSEKSLPPDLHPSMTVAPRARDGAVPWFRSGTVACVARHTSGERHLLVGPESCLDQFQIEPYGNVTASLRATAPAAEAAETATKELLQDVLEATELAEQVLSTKRFASIVSGPLLGVGENLVSLRYLSEALLGRGITRIRIGMCLSRELTKRLLDLFRRGGTIDTEDLVVVLH
jgi:hypothetical protein